MTAAWSTGSALTVHRLHWHTHSAAPLLVALEAVVDSLMGAVGDVVSTVAGHQLLMDTVAPPSVMWGEGC